MELQHAGGAAQGATKRLVMGRAADMATRVEFNEANRYSLTNTTERRREGDMWRDDVTASGTSLRPALAGAVTSPEPGGTILNENADIEASSMRLLRSQR